MFGGRNKNIFVRTRISFAERLLSWMLLGLISAIGAGVYLKGKQYDTESFAADATHFSPASFPYPRQVKERNGAPEIPPGDFFADLPLPDGWKRLGPVERFSAENLYEKIDGRAEQYLAYDVAGLTCVSLAGPDGAFIDLFAYDMGRPEDAFGIFSVERAPEHSLEDLGAGGYASGASFFFWKGPYYIQVLASDQGETFQQAARAIARRLDDRLKAPEVELWGLKAFPSTHRIPDSIQYFKKDALGLDFLANTYTAQYQWNGEEEVAFLSRQPSSQDAEAVFTSYLGYMEQYGRILEQRRKGDLALGIGELGGRFDVVCLRGKMVSGVSMAPDRAQAEQLAIELLEPFGEK